MISVGSLEVRMLKVLWVRDDHMPAIALMQSFDVNSECMQALVHICSSFSIQPVSRLAGRVVVALKASLISPNEMI